MTTRRSLPGFLRRSLRVDYDENDDHNDDHDEAGDPQSNPMLPHPKKYIIDADNDDDDECDGGEEAIIFHSESLIKEEQVTDETRNPLSQPTQGTTDNTITNSIPSSTTATSDTLPQRRQKSSWSSSHLDGHGQDHPGQQQVSASGTEVADPPPSRPKSYREVAMERVMNAPVVDLSELRKLGWNGIPPIYRGTAWKLLLGYLPANATRRELTLAKRRNEYRDAKAQHYDIDDDTRTLQEQETLRQVLVDVPRTAPAVPLFRHERIRRILSRLLYIWAMRHPASSYVQGINDLATPLIGVFLADYFGGQDVLDGTVMNHFPDQQLEELEADVYWCLTNLLAGIQDHYTADQPGVQRMVMRLEELVNRIDAELCRHFRECGIEFLQFAFKWMNCLLLREFSLKCVFRLWDTYLCEKDSFEDFHVYVCAAFLCQFSMQLRGMSFDDLFQFMQDIPTSEWTDAEIEVLLSQSYVLSTLFGGSDAHLTSSLASNTATSS